MTTQTHVPSGGYENNKRKGMKKGIMSGTLPPRNTALLLVFQHPPSSWKVIKHSHAHCKVLELWACEWFGETVGKIVMGGDIYA